MSDDTAPRLEYRFEHCLGVNLPEGELFVMRSVQPPTMVWDCVGHVDPETGYLVTDEMTLRKTEP